MYKKLRYDHPPLRCIHWFLHIEVFVSGSDRACVYECWQLFVCELVCTDYCVSVYVHKNVCFVSLLWACMKVDLSLTQLFFCRQQWGLELFTAVWEKKTQFICWKYDNKKWNWFSSVEEIGKCKKLFSAPRWHFSSWEKLWSFYFLGTITLHKGLGRLKWTLRWQDVIVNKTNILRAWGLTTRLPKLRHSQ